MPAKEDRAIFSQLMDWVPKRQREGVAGFSGEWETPAGDMGTYPYHTDESSKDDAFLWAPTTSDND